MARFNYNSTPRDERERIQRELEYKGREINRGSKRRQFKSGEIATNNLPPRRRSSRAATHTCFAGLFLYSVLAVALLISMAAADVDHIVIDDKYEGGVCCALESPNDMPGWGGSTLSVVNSTPTYSCPAAASSVTSWQAAAPAWLTWAEAQDVDPLVIAAIDTVAPAMQIPPAVLLAIGHVESGNDQTPSGDCDDGLAIGWGQVHADPWARYAREQLGRKVDLEDLLDNVLVAAMILEYSGYHDDPLRSYARYNGGPHYQCKEAKQYARCVAALVREIEGQ